jgi:hypothetical protein
MAAITVSNQRNHFSHDGRYLVRHVTLGAGSNTDTIAIRSKLGLRKVVRVWKEVSADFGVTYPGTPATGTNITAGTTIAAGTYRFEGA